MGNGCTKHFPTIDKKHRSVVAPAEPTRNAARIRYISEKPSTTGKVSLNPFDAPKKKSTNPFEDDDDDDDDNDAGSTVAVPPALKPLASVLNYAAAGTRPAVECSTTIDHNSILYRSREILSAGKRDVVRAHLHRESVPHLVGATRQKYLSEISVAAAARRKPAQPSYNFYRRLGGSFQTLVQPTPSSAVRTISVSETNLSKLGHRRSECDRFSLSRMRDIGGGGGSRSSSVVKGDYCPSVVFNRLDALRRQKERNDASAGKDLSHQPKKVDRSGWKSYLPAVSFLRKRKESNSRKT